MENICNINLSRRKEVISFAHLFVYQIGLSPPPADPDSKTAIELCNNVVFISIIRLILLQSAKLLLEKEIQVGQWSADVQKNIEE